MDALVGMREEREVSGGNIFKQKRKDDVCYINKRLILSADVMMVHSFVQQRGLAFADPCPTLVESTRIIKGG